MPRENFEQLQRALAPDWLINGYGPTEAVISPLAWKVPAGTTFDSAYAPVGRAVGPRRAYVLDALLQPVPPGVAGELYIGGAGVARGYLNRGDLTATRFIDNPFAPGERLYRTGDLARLREDGAVILQPRPGPDQRAKREPDTILQLGRLGEHAEVKIGHRLFHGGRHVHSPESAERPWAAPCARCSAVTTASTVTKGPLPQTRWFSSSARCSSRRRAKG